MPRMRSMSDRMVLERAERRAEDWTVGRRATLETMERLLGCAVREGLISADDQGQTLLLRLDDQDVGLRVPLGPRYALERFDLRGWPVDVKTGEEITSLARLVDRLHPGAPSELRHRLLDELENSRVTMEESLAALETLGPGQPGAGSLADWEGRVWLGHPLHPGARLRSGMGAAEHRAYGPEWQVALELPLLEIPSEDLILTGDFSERSARLFPDRIPPTGKSLVPVHPWAWKNDLPSRFESQFRDRRWRLSDITPLPARPTMSLRSVILESSHGQAHLKLPLAVQTTGATRTVSPAATHNGPELSRLLTALWNTPVARHLNGLHLMAEPASFRLADDSSGQARFLAGILRDSPGPSVDHNRWLLPAAALLEPRENPLFSRAAAYYGQTPQQLWRAYVQALLPPLAFLCGRMGIALEGHPQNIVVEFRGAPNQAPEIHFHYRDLGGIRLHLGQLEGALREWELFLEPPSFWPGSATSTDSMRDLASKFIYSVLQNHLGELSRAVVRSGQGEETLYWQDVREVLESCRESMGEDLAGRVFARDWDLKAMWRMRIDWAVTEYTYAPVRNPL